MAAFSNTPYRDIFALDVPEFPSDSYFSLSSSLPSDSPSAIIPEMITSGDLIRMEKKRKNGPQCNSNASQFKKSKNAKQERETEPNTEFIHVRARRGQATDSHSLAERARRGKIRERMKMLQGLVPGCDKVIGKALLLEEIINYVQSLQNQVEFLSMKLASLNPDTSSDGIIISPKNIRQMIALADTSGGYRMQDSSPSFSFNQQAYGRHFHDNGDGLPAQVDDNGESVFNHVNFGGEPFSFC